MKCAVSSTCTNIFYLDNGKVTNSKNAMKDMEKDKISLRNTKARIKVVEDKIKEQAQINEVLKTDITKLDQERSDIQKVYQLTSSFDPQIDNESKQSKSFRQKLNALNKNISLSKDQLGDVIKTKNINSDEINSISVALGDLLSDKNSRIEKLKLALTKARKRHNDTFNKLQKSLPK